MVRSIKRILLLIGLISMFGCKSVLTPFAPYFDMAFDLKEYSKDDIRKMIKIKKVSSEVTVYKGVRAIIDYNPTFVSIPHLQKTARIISEKNNKTGRIKHILELELTYLSDEQYSKWMLYKSTQLYQRKVLETNNYMIEGKKRKAKIVNKETKECKIVKGNDEYKRTCNKETQQIDVTKNYASFLKNGMNAVLYTNLFDEVFTSKNIKPRFKLPAKYFKALKSAIN